MTHAELVFIPIPAMGHLVPMVEMAKLLVDRDPCLSITFLIMKLPIDSGVDSYTNSLATSVSTTRIRFVHLPCENVATQISVHNFVTYLMESNKPHVKRAVAELADSTGSTGRLAGLVLDTFCTAMMDVADEFGIPSYAFFTSGAAFLGMMLHLQSLQDEHHVDITELKDSVGQLNLLSFTNPLPSKLLPSMLLVRETVGPTLERYRKIRATKGVIINTFDELEPQAVRSLAGLGSPAVYPVGPLLNLNGGTERKAADSGGQRNEIMEWLDQQPPSSVVFLCFGSVGTFDEDQMKEIASALERRAGRFLWSLRRPTSKGKVGIPREHVDPAELLPEGFLDRTAGIGKVIGWAPQVAILAHPAIGGFVSHCGWNSILESIWFGVPMATWPLYAEQQFNAFELVVELGLATELRMDYRKDPWLESDDVVVVTANEIEDGIRKLMEGEEAGERRKKMKEVSEKSRSALVKNGSSYLSLNRFIEAILN